MKRTNPVCGWETVNGTCVRLFLKAIPVREEEPGRRGSVGVGDGGRRDVDESEWELQHVTFTSLWSDKVETFRWYEISRRPPSAAIITHLSRWLTARPGVGLRFRGVLAQMFRIKVILKVCRGRSGREGFRFRRDAQRCLNEVQGGERVRWNLGVLFKRHGNRNRFCCCGRPPKGSTLVIAIQRLRETRER